MFESMFPAYFSPQMGGLSNINCKPMIMILIYLRYKYNPNGHCKPNRPKKDPSLRINYCNLLANFLIINLFTDDAETIIYCLGKYTREEDLASDDFLKENREKLEKFNCDEGIK